MRRRQVLHPSPCPCSYLLHRLAHSDALPHCIILRYCLLNATSHITNGRRESSHRNGNGTEWVAEAALDGLEIQAQELELVQGRKEGRKALETAE